MKASELRNQSVEELKTLEVKLSAEVFELTNELCLSDQPKSPHRVGLAKRLRARVLTIIREKQLSETTS